MPTSLSSRLPTGNGYKNRELRTTSGSFTVPENVFRVLLKLQAGGEAGSPSTPSAGGFGGRNGNFVAFELDVRPTDELSYVIGSGGVADYASVGTGGDTLIYLNNKLVGRVQGGGTFASNTMKVPQFIGSPVSILLTNYNPSLAVAGRSPVVYPPVSYDLVQGIGPTISQDVFTMNYLSGGSVTRGSGSGGNNSYYGKGGDGAADNQDGSSAPTTSYGAGGGGAGRNTLAFARKGGNGTAGAVEILY